jgi:hypothetical protein
MGGWDANGLMFPNQLFQTAAEGQGGGSLVPFAAENSAISREFMAALTAEHKKAAAQALQQMKENREANRAKGIAKNNDTISAIGT